MPAPDAGPRADVLTPIPQAKHGEFHFGQPGGYVIGGTAWKLANRAQVASGQFDLLVVDEAAQVVRMVRELLGTPWTDPTVGRTRNPLTERDFIVVTPYNAQCMEVERALHAVGLADVPVGTGGTVDKFQGQEAVEAIVTLAASSALDAPRGMEFLVNRNRLNAAVSCAKSAARIVYSLGLLRHLPGTPEKLVELGRFARLVAPK